MNEQAPPSVPDVAALYAAQRRFFATGRTRSRPFREAQLRALDAAIQRHGDRLADALYADLHKPAFEAWTAEISFTLAEVRHALSHLKRWMQPTRSLPPVLAQPSRGMVVAEPLGPTLILGAWNYPVQLVLAPLIPAIAAGNVAILKPSELAPHSASAVRELIASTFSEEYVACVEGGVETSQALLAQPFAHLFYTGGTRVGRIVARAGAEHLSRVTLELGGKSPCIVMPSANLEVAARRIAWGKWMNAGQTCIAPDYVLVHHSVRDALIEALAGRVRAMYGDDPKQSPDFGRIVNASHHARLIALLDADKVRFGGRHDASDRYIEPTIMADVTWDDPVMREEIFGPILPVIGVDSLDVAIAHVGHAPDPLALYLFSEDPAERDAVVGGVSFGGGCINNTALHLADPALPFGGVRTSGTGSYHGHYGFEAFSHRKAVLESNTTKVLDLPLKYPPYEGKLSKVKWLLP